jgi:hypothetical protein
MTAAQHETHRHEGQHAQEARQARDQHERAVNAGRAPAIPSTARNAHGNEGANAPMSHAIPRSNGATPSAIHTPPAAAGQRSFASPSSNFAHSAAPSRQPTVSHSSFAPANSHVAGPQHQAARPAPATRPPAHLSAPSSRSSPTRSSGHSSTGHSSAGHSSGGHNSSGHHR